jgi:HNH endonuclease
VVDHIDGVRDNNDASNLFPCTQKENSEAAVKSGKRYLCPVLQYDKTGTALLKRYDSVADAARAVGAYASNIHNTCLQRSGYNTTKGFVWRYPDEDEDDL